MSDSDSDYSNADSEQSYNSKSFTGKGLDEKSKRYIHNAAEQKRRNTIKESFKKLHESLPKIKHDKASRATVLQEAVRYIKEKQEHLKTHQDEMDTLKRQNFMIEQQIQMLSRRGNL